MTHGDNRRQIDEAGSGQQAAQPVAAEYCTCPNWPRDYRKCFADDYDPERPEVCELCGKEIDAIRIRFVDGLLPLVTFDGDA